MWDRISGIVILGVLWSMWYLPVQLARYNYPDHPILGSFILSPLELLGVPFFIRQRVEAARDIQHARFARVRKANVQVNGDMGPAEV